MMPMWVPPQPVPGMKIKAPLAPPGPGQVVVQYHVEEPEAGCCKCDTLSQGGLIAMIALILIFWPLAFIPCVSADCHEKVQRPVYGNPPAAPPMYQAAAPMYQGPPAPYQGQPAPEAYKGV